MKTIEVQQNQTIADVILAAYGTMEAEATFCQWNDVAPDYLPEPGTVYEVPEASKDVAAMGLAVLTNYKNNNIVPATRGDLTNE